MCRYVRVLGDDFDGARAAACAGEEWGFAVLYGEFAPSVLGFLRGRIPSDAEDVAATVWLDAARSLGRFEGDEAGFRAWLFTIVRRRLLNELRRRRRDHADLYDPVTLPVGTSAAPTRGAENDPEAIVVAAFDAAEAVELIGRVLPELQAEVVLHRVVSGLSVTEIAELLGLTPGHVRVVAHRGLRALAAHFSHPVVTDGASLVIPEVP